MPAPGSTEQQPYHHGDLRNALVQAAVELARDGGPTAIILREAARRVGVSPTAAYRHFRALPELIEAAAGSALAALARSIEAELADCKASCDVRQAAWDHMQAVGRGYIHFAVDEPGLFATAFGRQRGAVKTPGGTGRSGLTPWELLEQALDGLLAAGMLAAEDRAAAATMAWAAVHGQSTLFLGPLRGVPPVEREAIIEATLDLVGRGLIIRT